MQRDLHESRGEMKWMLTSGGVPVRRARTVLAVTCVWMVGLAAPSVQSQSPREDRVALVVGNAAYPESPLANPGNDARAVADLLHRAGFKVDLRLDTKRAALLQAVNQFGGTVRAPGVRFGVFYYAGHGFQQDWRNYLVPIDAKVHSAADVPKQTVDVSELLRHLNEAKGRNFLVILDACRDDPFAGEYRPPAKGLSQFDAPVGSLLAYATAPGRVALDGVTGGNGLYTKHLVRELESPEATLEDAFKRVRLNVRMESKGRQIPWEMASLEEDVYLFPQRREKLGVRELEARFEAELAAWTQVRQNTSIPGLVEFIRKYPTGNTSELAQARLNRLLAEEFEKDEAARRDRAERQSAEQLAARMRAEALPAPGAAAGTPTPAEQPRPATTPSATQVPRPSPTPDPATIVAAAPKLPLPPGVRPSPAEMTTAEPLTIAALPATPFFSGFNEHRRDYRVGDRFEYQVVDLFTQAKKPLSLRVTAVDVGADRVEFNGGDLAVDLMGNTVSNTRGSMSTPRQFYPAELVVGKRWHTEFKQERRSGWTYHFRYDVKVAARERITVPAGTFDAYRIEAQGFNVGLSANIKRTIWVAPGINADIAHETFVRLRNGQIEQNDRQELVSYSRG